MKQCYNILVVLGLVLCFSTGGFAGRYPLNFFQRNSKDPVMRTRVSIAPIIGIYSVNQNVAQEPRQRMSGLFSVREEIRLNTKHTIYLLIGAEYLVHGVNFYSYYFKEDSLRLYTGNMDYRYSLYIHEIDIPLQLKLSLNHENNAVYTPYIMLGYHFRTIFAGNLKVEKNGELIEKKGEDIKFRNPLFNPKSNAFASITFGVQKNNIKHPKRCVFAELSYRQGFSQFYISDNFTPSSLFVNGSYLSFSLGLKF